MSNRTIVVVDNNIAKLPEKRRKGFLSAEQSYNQLYKKEQIHLEFVKYNALTKKIIDEANGFILSGSHHKLTDFYSSINKRNLFNNEIDLIRTVNVPILGICFGHELIGIAFNAKIVDCQPETDRMTIEFSAPFPLLPSRKNVNVEMQHIRKILHDERFDAFFDVFASTQSVELAIIGHKFKTIYGVQFHPESLDYWSVKDGQEILHNFFSLVAERQNI